MKWTEGRQGTGYFKSMLLGFDSYIIKYPQGSFIPPHKDPVDKGSHYRLNIVLKKPKCGGIFNCNSVIFQFGRVTLFRSDINEHFVSPIVVGERVVLSIGVVL